MSALTLRLRTWLWWLVPLVALALLLAIETDWGRAVTRVPAPAPVLEPKPVTAALLPEYRIDGGLEAHSETVARTLFNPTRRPAPAAAADTKRQMTRGQFVLTGTAVAGERHIAFLREINGGKSRVVRQGEQLNGLLVATVSADRVKLTLGDESEELVLKVAVGPKTTTQPAPPAPRRPPGQAGAMPTTALPGAAPPAGATGAHACLADGAHGAPRHAVGRSCQRVPATDPRAARARGYALSPRRRRSAPAPAPRPKLRLRRPTRTGTKLSNECGSATRRPPNDRRASTQRG